MGGFGKSSEGGGNGKSVLGFYSRSKIRFKPIRFSPNSRRWQVDQQISSSTSHLLQEDEVTTSTSRIPAPNSSTEDCYLPEELVTEVLEWLPIKSIVKFRLVSKSWSALFKTPTFTTNHRLKQQRTKSGTMLLLRRRRIPPHTDHDFLSFHDLDSPEQEVRPELPISPYLNDQVGYYDNDIFAILGPVNGIICIYTAWSFILCNPALHEFKLLPRIPFSDDNYGTPAGYGFCFRAFGFGVSSSGDFKVIAFHRFINTTDNTFLPSVVANLYNSRTMSWTRFDDSTLFPCASICANCLVNGAWHWPGTTFSSDDKVIVSFDVTSEVFRQLELPYSLRGSDVSFPRLSIINNCLGAVYYNQIFSNSEPGEVWVMKEYGDTESWSKLFAITPQPFATTLLPWKTDTMFMLQQRGCHKIRGCQIHYDSKANDQLTSIDMRTSEMKEFQVFGAQHTIRGRRIFMGCGYGNCRICFRERTVFPELACVVLGKEMDIDVCIVTTANTDKEAHRLLALMGIPFRPDAGPSTTTLV